MTTITKKEYQGKEFKTVFGGMKVLVRFYIEAVNYGIVNKYEVTCEIRGIESGSPEMEVVRVVALTNNEETLVAYAIADLCGWECATGIKTETKDAA